MISVVMGADTTKERNAAVSKMLDYAFNHYETENLYEKGETITTIDFLKAEQQTVDVTASESISTIHKKGKKTKSNCFDRIERKSDPATPKRGSGWKTSCKKQREDIVHNTTGG